MLLFATLSAENPNGKPGLLTISLSEDSQGITLPIFDWMTLNVSSGREGYLLTNFKEYNNWPIYNGTTWADTFQGDLVISNEDYVDLSKASVSIDFHIQLWNR